MAEAERTGKYEERGHEHVPHLGDDGRVCADEACGVCGGYGSYVPKPDEALQALVLEAPWLAEFLEARHFIETHGLASFITLHGTPSEPFLDALNYFGGCLAEARHKDAVEEAKREAAKVRKK